MIKNWLGLLLIAGLAAGVWVAAGPFLTIRAIDRAVRENDQALLDRNVDFAVLRRNLKPQVSAQLRQKARKKGTNEFLGALAEAYSDTIADKLVDALITPQGIDMLLDSKGDPLRPKKKKRRRAEAPQPAGPTPAAKPKEPTHTRWFFVSPNEFAVKRQKGQKRTTFVLNRYGLSWKLTNIILPEQAPRTPAADAAEPSPAEPAY
jgi:hypothetical protein